MVGEGQLRPEFGAGMNDVAGVIVGAVRMVRSRSEGRIGSRQAALLLDGAGGLFGVRGKSTGRASQHNHERLNSDVYGVECTGTRA